MPENVSGRRGPCPLQTQKWIDGKSVYDMDRESWTKISIDEKMQERKIDHTKKYRNEKKDGRKNAQTKKYTAKKCATKICQTKISPD